MIKGLLLILTCTSLMTSSFIDPPNKMLGRWKARLSDSEMIMQYFRTDGTIDVFLNGKTFVNGTYKIHQDTLFVSDPVCGRDYYGSYRLTYLTPDSVRQTIIQDTCRGRRTTYALMPTMGRLKAAKP